MAIVKPFKAVRPSKEVADKMISLPYDVMSREEAAAMADGNPYSFLHICRSEIDLPGEKDPYCEAVYKKASSNIADFLSEGVLIRDEKPMFYIYRQIMDGRTQTGIVACCSIDDYLQDNIKKHEFTRVEKEIDRINHFDVCNANTEPVFLTYRDNLKIRSIVEGWISGHTPDYDITTNDGIRHILWIVNADSVITSIETLFGDVPALYIADGHHRSASAVKVGLKRREENPDFDGCEEFNRFMAVIFPDNDLKIFDYNRVIKDLNGLSAKGFITEVAKNFEIEEIGDGSPFAPSEAYTFGMFLEGKWYKLTAKPEIIEADDPIKSLDVSILQDNLLAPILGIKDPRTDKRIDFIGGIRGLKELERRVALDMKVAFSLFPASLSQLLEVADRSLVMPPKSTWFEPKLGSGLFIHEL